jgi:hypothetical protein
MLFFGKTLRLGTQQTARMESSTSNPMITVRRAVSDVGAADEAGEGDTLETEAFRESEVLFLTAQAGSAGGNPR